MQRQKIANGDYQVTFPNGRVFRVVNHKRENDRMGAWYIVEDKKEYFVMPQTGYCMPVGSKTAALSILAKMAG